MHWVDVIKKYCPQNEQETKDKELILYAIERFEDVLTRNNKIAHFTSSAFAVNKSRDRFLWCIIIFIIPGLGLVAMLMEKKILKVALKELREETGVIHARPVMTDIFSWMFDCVCHIKRGNIFPRIFICP